jgi:hypothetical protein
MVCEDGDLLLQTRVEPSLVVSMKMLYMLVCWRSNTGPAMLRPIFSALPLRRLDLYLCRVSHARRTIKAGEDGEGCSDLNRLLDLGIQRRDTITWYTWLM